MVEYLFRRPVYPLLIETDNCIRSAKNRRQLNRIIETAAFGAKKFYDVIDSTGEGWSFSLEHSVISPLTLKKRWHKKEIIAFYNSFFSPEDLEKAFIGSSLSNKRIPLLVQEIVNHDQEA